MLIDGHAQTALNHPPAAIFALLVFSLMFYRLVRGLWLGSERGARPMLDDIEAGMLLGGPERAIEVGLFLLARDGMIRHDGSGRFVSRFADPHSEFGADELGAELMSALNAHQGLSAHACVRLKLGALEQIEGTLARRGLVMTELEHRQCALLALSGFILTGAIAVLIGLTELRHGHPAMPCFVEALVAMLLFFEIGRRMNRRTAFGARIESEIRAEIGERQRALRQTHLEHGYDPLWGLKDEVLVHGLSRMAGTAFAPLSTFASAPLRQPPRSLVMEEASARHTSAEAWQAAVGSSYGRGSSNEE